MAFRVVHEGHPTLAASSALAGFDTLDTLVAVMKRIRVLYIPAIISLPPASRRGAGRYRALNINFDDRNQLLPLPYNHHTRDESHDATINVRLILFQFAHEPPSDHSVPVF